MLLSDGERVSWSSAWRGARLRRRRRRAYATDPKAPGHAAANGAICATGRPTSARASTHALLPRLALDVHAEALAGHDRGARAFLGQTAFAEALLPTQLLALRLDALRPLDVDPRLASLAGARIFLRVAEGSTVALDAAVAVTTGSAPASVAASASLLSPSFGQPARSGTARTAMKKVEVIALDACVFPPHEERRCRPRGIDPLSGDDHAVRDRGKGRFVTLRGTVASPTPTRTSRRCRSAGRGRTRHRASRAPNRHSDHAS